MSKCVVRLIDGAVCRCGGKENENMLQYIYIINENDRDCDDFERQRLPSDPYTFAFGFVN